MKKWVKIYKDGYWDTWINLYLKTIWNQLNIIAACKHLFKILSAIFSVNGREKEKKKDRDRDRDKDKEKEKDKDKETES